MILVFGLAFYALSTLISMATMSIGAGVLAVCLLIHFRGPKTLYGELAEAVRSNRMAKVFLAASAAFVLACILSLIAGKLWPLSYDGKSSAVHLLKDSAKLWYFAWPFPLWLGLRACSDQDRKRILWAWIGTFLVLSVLAFYQHYTGWPRPQNIPTDWAHYHATLFLGHHLSVASILIFPFFALLDLPGVPVPSRIVAASIGFLGLMLTYSRTLWVALPIGLVVWAFLKLNRRARIAIVLLLVLGVGAASQVPSLKRRVFHPMGLHEREDLWEANWKFFLERPLTGVGLKHNEELSGYYLMQKYHTTDVFQGHAHNNVLDILGSTGLIGFAGFVAWWGVLFWMLASELRSKQSSLFFGKGLLAALAVYQINGLTQVNFWEAKVQHQLMWIMAWILLWSEAEKRNSPAS